MGVEREILQSKFRTHPTKVLGGARAKKVAVLETRKIKGKLLSTFLFKKK